jgi:polar amino acid transport system permease protein
MNAIEILWSYRYAFIDGFTVTLELLALACLIGTILGIGLELLSRIFRVLRQIVDAVAFCVSAIPALVILFWLYYPAQSVSGVSLSPFWTAAISLVVINAFAVYRIVADAVADFPQQYVSSALVCGLKPTEILRYIQGPLLVRAALPRWIDQQVVILQTSVFASLISVEEIFRVAQRINSIVYQPVVIYTSMAIVFLVTAGSAMYLAMVLRKRFYRDLSEH